MLRFAVIVGPSVAATLFLSANPHTPTRTAPSSARPSVEQPSIPQGIRPLSPLAAFQLNASIPFSNQPIVAAKPFRFAGGSENRERAIECLTSAVYYEAGQESRDGQAAVAQVVLNRVRNSAFPATVCGVVFEGSTRPSGCQFSFTCDGSLMRVPEPSAWARARQVAEAELSGEVYAPVGLSTHYHADYVVPYWATVLAKNVQIGAHIFYSWPGSWGTLAAFLRHPSMSEPDPVALAGAALMSHDLWRASPLGHSIGLQFHEDASVELTGVVDVLARPQSTSDTPLENEIRAYFAAQSDHPVVQLFRYAQSRKENPTNPSSAAKYFHAASLPVVGSDGGSSDRGSDAPQTYSIDGWLRDFADKSDFADFLRSHRQDYALASKDIANIGDRAAANWNAYTGIPLEGGNVTLTLTLHGAGATVLPAGADALRGSLLWSDRGRVSEADLIARSGAGARSVLNRAAASAIDAETYHDIVAAVFLRVAALSGGAAPEPAQSMTCGDSGRAARFAAKLRTYEHHRDQFPTLADFVPFLLAGESPASGPTCAARPAQVQ